MIDPSQKYREALAAFAVSGNRWNAKGPLTYWARAAGLTAEDLIEDAHAAGVTDRDADLRRGWADAPVKGDAVRGVYVPRVQKPNPPQHADRVRDLIAVGRDGDTFADIRALSPWFAFFAPPRRQAADFLRAAFAPDERLFVFRGDMGTKGRPGANIRTRAAWVQAVERGETLPGDLVKINPFTGEEGRTANGSPSYVSQDCLAAYPFALIEFDALPLPDQCRFWCGFIQASRLAPALVSLTYSGGKSVHGLLYVGCRTRAEWDAARNRLAALLAADPDPRFRADAQALHPLIGTRLPGVTRRDKGAAQELVYLNPAARAHAHTHGTGA